MTRRYPLDPLAALMGCTIHVMGDRLHVSGSSMQDWRERGVTWQAADRLAIKAGYHPYVIWPEMLDHALEETAGLPDIDETLDDARRRKERERHARRMARRREAA